MAGTKKREVIDADWVDECIISQIPAELVEESEILAEAIRDWRQQKEMVPSVYLSELFLSTADFAFTLPGSSKHARGSRRL